jgi:glutathione synthase/RimK-type ligase-like ATP-grasp enzyme
MTDITILTDPRYTTDYPQNPYKHNVFLEDDLLLKALIGEGLKCNRVSWDDKDYQWCNSKALIFRSTWDYFDRYDEFYPWLMHVKTQTLLINSKELIEWNIDKHYLMDIKNNGVKIPKSVFIEKGNTIKLVEHCNDFNNNTIIIKPCISGAARLTFKLFDHQIEAFSSKFEELIKEEAFIIQEFLTPIEVFGEISLILFNGEFSHAVLKKAKPGDFRVQDDHGGTVHNYVPNLKEIHFAETAVKACPEMPVYARVDISIDNYGQLVLIELELIEPELWLRHNKTFAKTMAKAIKKHIKP